MWEGAETQDRTARGWTGAGEAAASANAGPFSEDKRQDPLLSRGLGGGEWGVGSGEGEEEQWAGSQREHFSLRATPAILQWHLPSFWVSMGLWSSEPQHSVQAPARDRIHHTSSMQE